MRYPVGVRLSRVVVLASLVSSCAPSEADLFVDLRTDFVPGVEFLSVRTTVDGDAAVTSESVLGEDFVGGSRVAELGVVETGTRTLLVELLDGSGAVVAERTVRYAHAASSVATVLITRDCAGVVCDTASAPSCYGGECATASCLDGTQPECAEIRSECSADADCPARVSCARGVCSGGVCLEVMAPGECAAGEYCAVESGCAAIFTPGMLTAQPHRTGLEGDIRVTFALPPELGGAMRLDVRRVPGDVAPADCAEGELVETVTDLSGAEIEIIDRIPDRWNRTHSYRACFFDGAGGAIPTPDMVQLGVRYYNPGPGCHQPPCELVNTTVAAGGPPVLGPAVLTATGTSGGDALLSDVNGDDVLDVVIATNAVNTVHLGNGDGTFGPALRLSTRAATTMAAVTGDFDNDGNKDLVFANRGVPSYIQLGVGDGTFDGGTDIYPESLAEIFDVEAADLNGDTFLDLVFASFGAVDQIYLGDGTGRFARLGELQPFANNSCVNCLQIRDVTGDLVPDIVLAYNTDVSGTTTRLDIFVGAGDATFAAPIPVGFGSLTPISVRLADLDNDGLLDVVVGRSLGGGIFVGLGDGAGSFTSLTSLATTTISRSYGLAANDFDGDGNVDIIFSEDDQGIVAFLRGGGDGTFDAQVELDAGPYTTSNIDAGDIDGDGTIDILVGVATGSSLVFLGR